MNLELLLEELGPDIRVALERALSHVDPTGVIDTVVLSRHFVASLRSRCDGWQGVPDGAIRYSL